MRDPSEARLAMVREIEAQVVATFPRTGIRVLDPRVLAAMAAVPRHEFVPEPQRPFAYDDRALPLGSGQTISQPFVVALMTHLLEPRADDDVLEVGTGSGYQAAVLATLVRKVRSIELDGGLAAAAAERLARLGFANVEVRAGDGTLGWPEAAPFDGVIVTAATPEVPPALLAQLREGRHLVAPLGPHGLTQSLTRVTKLAGGRVARRAFLEVEFVPLRRAE